MPKSGPTSNSYYSQRLRLHYVDWGNLDAQPLLMVHGGRDHCRNWDWVANALRNDYHIIAPDLRGHGDSAWMVGGNYNTLDYVYDIAQLLHQNTAGPVKIIAHSMGGSVALTYAGLYPELVSRLIVIEGMGPSPKMLAETKEAPSEIGISERLNKHTQIENIHAHPAKGVFMITGGDTQLISSLLMVPGGSDTILQALVPYSEAALKQHLGFAPHRTCSEETARWMAMRAYQLASKERSELTDTVFGLAITASLASLRPKKGKHRIHIAAQTRSTTFTWSLTLKKDHRIREGEEALCGNMALNALCEVMHLEPLGILDLHTAETMLSHSVEGGEDLQRLLFSPDSTSSMFYPAQTQAHAQTGVRNLYFQVLLILYMMDINACLRWPAKLPD